MAYTTPRNSPEYGAAHCRRRVDDAPSIDLVMATRRDGRGVITLELRGSLDVATAPVLFEHLTLLLGTPEVVGIELDVADLHQVDVCGLHAILRASTRALLSGRSLVVVHPPRSLLIKLRLVNPAHRLRITVAGPPDGVRSTDDEANRRGVLVPA